MKNIYQVLLFYKNVCNIFKLIYLTPVYVLRVLNDKSITLLCRNGLILNLQITTRTLPEINQSVIVTTEVNTVV